jgi:hypothetical protein
MEDKMVELTRFTNPTEAEILVSLLHSEGIDCYVRDAILSQEFMGYADIGGAKVELLLKDVARAKQIMREHGYEVADESEEAIESENAEMINAEYEKNKANLSKKMTIIVICLLIILALIIFLNKFYKL